MSSEGAEFDLTASLPAGTTILEASAGTGKTFTIAALAVRYVAEQGVALADLLLMTFSRAATRELRERVWQRLFEVEDGLRDSIAARASSDRLLVLIADCDDEELNLRRSRLTRALTDFDAATISTTHQFCQGMLRELGIAGDRESGAAFVEDMTDLTAEVVEDLYLRMYSRPTTLPAFLPALAHELADKVVVDGQADLVPTDAAPDSLPQLRYRFGLAVRSEVDRRKRVRRVFTYDDMVTRLLDALRDPVRGDVACARVRQRFQVVLVDEFQDTDPVQWAIVNRAFHGYATLVLIGDPKQAIYGFRGADVYSYLDAVSKAGARSTLATNWRADEQVVAALEKVMGGVALGDRRIRVRPVMATHDKRLSGAPQNASLRLRVVSRAGLPLARRGGLPVIDPVRERVADDVAQDIGALLASDAKLMLDEVQRDLQPGDICVLVRTNRQASLVRESLATLGVTAVLASAMSVFSTVAAREWLTLLEGLEQPNRSARVRAAALTVFFGYSVADLLSDVTGDAVVERTALALRSLGTELASGSVAGLIDSLDAMTQLPARVLGTVDGERKLTDIRHVGQLLHAQALAGQLGPTGLCDWLRKRISESQGEPSPERVRRLDSDADAVQIVTVHRSKGLEFPIVYVPFAWEQFTGKDGMKEPAFLRLHEGSQRILDVGGRQGAGWQARLAEHEREAFGEELRLLYVALTRAQCQVVCWWAPNAKTQRSPLHQLLFGKAPDGTLTPAPVPDDAVALATLQLLADENIAVELADSSRNVTAGLNDEAAVELAELSAAVFDRPIDLLWRRNSFTGLTSRAHNLSHALTGARSEPELEEVDDETDVSGAEGAIKDGVEVEQPTAMASPMANLPAGASFGTFIHEIFENLQASGDGLPERLIEQIELGQNRRSMGSVDVDDLSQALLAVLATPLGPLAADLALSQIPDSDRLAEMDFELPVSGGDSAGDPVDLRRLVDLLRRHLLASDPLAGYADFLESSGVANQDLKGFLTGSLDVVLRVEPQTGTRQPRYLVVDYKTNWLGPYGPLGPEPLLVSHYNVEAMSAAMMSSHYPLQALFYSVALHRYLRWRQPLYEPSTHLGGVLYLFVRGMAGPDTPRVNDIPSGVFSWRPPHALVEELSALLSGSLSEQGAGL